MIKLTLLHPFQSTPVRSWTFQQEPIIRIGRSTKNHVVLYSAVVSRRHVELRQVERGWKIINLGTNGTYIEGVPISESWVKNGIILHLAISGPQIQLNIGANALDPQPDYHPSRKAKDPVQVLDSEKLHTQITTISSSHLQSLSPIETYEDITEVDSGDRL